MALKLILDSEDKHIILCALGEYGTRIDNKKKKTPEEKDIVKRLPNIISQIAFGRDDQ
jgi:hypothetical protein